MKVYPMSVILLVAVFAAVLGSVLVIADSAVRGRNAFRALRAQPASGGVQVPVSIRFEDFVARPALPALRQRTAKARQARRPVRTPLSSPSPSLHAAA